MREVIAEGDAGGGGFDLRFEGRVVRWRKSRGHNCCCGIVLDSRGRDAGVAVEIRMLAGNSTNAVFVPIRNLSSALF